MNEFDLVAKDYDTDIRIKRAHVIADKIRTHVADGGTKSAVDYGCGTGLVGLQLSGEFMRLLFVDSSSEMIAQVERKLEKLERPFISTLCTDFIETVPQDLHVDYIFSSLVLHHIKDTEGILRHFYNVLNNAGHLLFVELDSDDGRFHAKHPGFDGHNGFEQSSLVDLATKVGFANVKTETFYYGIKSINGKEHPYSLFILDAMKEHLTSMNV